MKVTLKGLGLAAAVGLAGSCNTALAQNWSDDFESYSPGQVLDHVGGWYGWDNVSGVCGSCSTTFAHGGTKSLLDENSDDAIHNFAYTNGTGTITAWIYTPTSGFIADNYFIVNNEYNDGGPYHWCIQLQLDFGGDGGGGPLTVADDLRVDTNHPPIAFDQWVQIRCELSIDSNTITTYYNNVEVSTGVLFVEPGALEIQNLDLYTTGSKAYYDDLSITGLSGTTPEYTCTVTGSCPGTVNVAWANAQPNKQQGIVFASNLGSTTIPNGPCQGTVLGLGTQNIRLVNTVGTGNGAGSVNGQAGGGACGGHLQLVTIATPCEASTVGHIP